MEIDLRSKVVSFIIEKGLLQKRSSILLSMSAGKDSMALYDIIRFISRDWDLSVSVFHLNHCLRGKDSDADEVFLKDLCVRDGIPFFSERHDFTLESAGSFEERARNERYTRMRRLINEHNFNAVLTAHTKSDSVETVMMRMVTGTHIHGLTGIPVVRDCFIRPLLCATSEEVYTYLKSSGLSWREDLSNEDQTYSRNFIRHTVIPLMTSRFPRTVVSLFDLSSAAAGNERLLLKLAASAGIKAYKSSGEIRYGNNPLLQDYDIFCYCFADILYGLGSFVSGEKLSEAFKRFHSAKGKTILVVKMLRKRMRFVTALKP